MLNPSIANVDKPSIRFSMVQSFFFGLRTLQTTDAAW
jgi:hypothetical protein